MWQGQRREGPEASGEPGRQLCVHLIAAPATATATASDSLNK